MNTNNLGIFVGRLTKDPVFYENGDGSHLVLLNLACQQNFPSGADHAYQSDFIEFRGYIPKKRKNMGIYEYLHTGDKVSVSYSLRSSVSEKDGKRTYYQNPFIESVQIQEGRAVREERREKRGA